MPWRWEVAECDHELQNPTSPMVHHASEMGDL